MYEKLHDEFNRDLILESLAHQINSEMTGVAFLQAGHVCTCALGSDCSAGDTHVRSHETTQKETCGHLNSGL